MTMTKGRKPVNDWQEVTRGHPCPVCKKPDWCRISRDGKWCACRRESQGAKETKQYGDGSEAYIHLLRDNPPNGKPHPTARPPGDASSIVSPKPTADAETRDRAYRMLLGELQLSEPHRDNLRARGLTDEHIEVGGYRTHDTHYNALKLWYALGDAARTIPGLSPTKILAPSGLLVPVRDLAGRIIALRIRPDDPGDGGKYRYLSSRSDKYPDGPSPGSPAHIPVGITGPCPVARITEGELKADASWWLSSVPTVSFPGVASWRAVLGVLTELRCKTVRVAFDADAASNANVARSLRECVKELAALGYAIELERWPVESGKGIDDLLLAGGMPEVLTGPEALQAVRDIAKAAGVPDDGEPEQQKGEPAEPKNKTDPTPPWVPFPVDVLPEPLSDFTQAVAEALGCDSAYVALPLLSTLAAAVGNSRRVRIKQSWTEPCVMWTVTIGRSGTMKSPAWETAVRPLQDLQTRAFREHEAAMIRHRQDMSLWEANHHAWKTKGRRSGEPPPEKPDEPIAVRYIASDATVEALADLLRDTPRGILLARDELSGWLSSFDAYKGVRGADVAHWLSMHRAGPLTVDRKTGRRTTHIPRAAVCIAGSVQPSILAAALGGRYEGEEDSGEHFANGLAARLLLAYPPIQPKRWREADLSDDITQRIARLVNALLTMEAEQDDFGEQRPVNVGLTPDAKREFIRFFESHAAEQVTLGDNLAAAWSKLEGYAARFALLFHLVRVADGDRTAGGAVDLQDMQTGIALSRWFADEAARIYVEIGGGTDDAKGRQAREYARLVEWIRDHGGTVTPRKLAASGPQRYRGTADEAEALLRTLAEAGCGEIVTPPHDGPGRPPGIVFRVLDSVDVETKLPVSAESESFVSFPPLGISQSEKTDPPQNADDGWGEV